MARNKKGCQLLQVEWSVVELSVARCKADVRIWRRGLSATVLRGWGRYRWFGAGALAVAENRARVRICRRCVQGAGGALMAKPRGAER